MATTAVILKMLLELLFSELKGQTCLVLGLAGPYWPSCLHSCLLSCTSNLLYMGIYSKRKEFAYLASNFSQFRVELFQMGIRAVLTVALHESLSVWLNPCHASDATSTINCQPIWLLDPGCWYKFTYWKTNSEDTDQLASKESNWSESTLFAKAEHIWDQQDQR